MIDIAALPVSDSGFTHELQGEDHGDVPASLLFLELPPGGGPSWHQHDYTELLVILEGEITADVGDDHGTASTGQVVVVPPRTPHRFTNTGPGVLRQIDIHLNGRTVTDWIETGAEPARPAAPH